ncbi:EcsC protein family protein [Lentzea albidocapillata subsp. violacea]|uniref:EcsC protein family protein n=1 Tax=Lentzea albidocapillata subsp. violacea TaxID=128104 RepID=A0A1G9BRZ3_9PSEU|nr:EcsC protein family protein [Lentzea albidocapillata subsp. violacea]
MGRTRNVGFVAESKGELNKAQQGIADYLLRAGVDGFGPFKSAREAASDALVKKGDETDAIKHLVRTHVALAGAQGFLTNLGGLITLPISLPSNVAATYVIQTHLIASIASLRGHDVDSDEVQMAILLCLLGNAGTELFKKVGIKQFTKKAASALITKYGTKKLGTVVAKGVPLLGGVIGGGVDAASTRAVGAFANRYFTHTDVLPKFIDGEVLSVQIEEADGTTDPR